MKSIIRGLVVKIKSTAKTIVTGIKAGFFATAKVLGTLVKKIAGGIKVVAVFVWKYFLSYIFYFFVYVFKAIYLGSKWVIVKIAILIKIISVFVWKYLLSYIIKFFIKVLKLLYLALKYSAIKIAVFTRFIATCIWKYFLRYFYLFIKFIINSFYKYILVNIYLFFTHLAFFLYRGIVKLGQLFKWFLLLIYNKIIVKIAHFISICVRFIWNKIIRQIAKFINKVLLGLWFVIKKIYFGIRSVVVLVGNYVVLNIVRAVKFIVIKLIEFIKISLKYLLKGFELLFESLKYFVKSIPDFIYQFFILVFIYVGLVIHFIIIKLPQFVFYTLPRFIFKYTRLLLVKLFELIGRLFKVIYLGLIRVIKIISKEISKIVNHLRDYLEYYYIVLLAPIIIPIFIILFISSTVIGLFVFVSIVIKTIFGIRVLERNEVIYIKNKYRPSTNLISNVISHLNNLRYEYFFSNRTKTIWLLICILSWQLIYIIILLPIAFILLLPLTIISFGYLMDKDILARVVIVSEECNGMIRLKNKKMFNKVFSFDLSDQYHYDEIIKQIITNNEDILVSLKEDNQTIKTYQLKVISNQSLEAIKLFNTIKGQLQKIKYYRMTLPVITNNSLIVKYETIYNRDKIIGDTFILRKLVKSTSIKVIITNVNKKVLIEHDVYIANIINPTKLISYAFADKILKIKSGANIRTYLDKNLDYQIVSSPYISEEGQILCQDDSQFKCRLLVNGIDDVIYNIKIKVIATDSLLEKQIKYLEENFLDYQNKTVILNNIKTATGEKEVDWYINHSIVDYFCDLRAIFDSVILDSNTKVEVAFMFNDKYIKRSLNLNRPIIKNDNYHLDLLLRILEGSFLIVDKEQLMIKPIRKYLLLNQKYYIKLPILGSNRLLFLRWVAKDKGFVKATGKISGDFNQARFKVVCYYGLFKKRSIDVTLVKKHDE